MDLAEGLDLGSVGGAGAKENGVGVMTAQHSESLTSTKRTPRTCYVDTASATQL